MGYWKTIEELENKLRAKEDELVEMSQNASRSATVANGATTRSEVLVSELESTKSRLHKASSDLQAAQELSAATQARMGELEAVRRAAEAQGSVLKERTVALDAAQRRVRELEAQHTADLLGAEALKREHLTQLHLVEDSRNKFQAVAERETVRAQELQRECDLLHNDLVGLRHQMDRLRDEHESANEMLNRSANMLEDERGEMASMQQKISDLQQQIFSERQERIEADQRATHTELMLRDREHQAQMDAAAAAEVYEERIGSLESQLADAKMENGTLSMEFDILRINMNKLEMAKERLQVDADMLPEVRAELETTNAALETVTAERAALHEMMVARMGVEETLEYTTQERDRLAAEAAMLREHLERVDAERVQHKQDLALSQQALQHAQSDLEARRAEWSEWKTKLESENASLTTRLARTSEELAVTTRELTQRTADLNALRVAHEELQKVAQRDAEALARAEAHIRDLDDTLRERNATIAFLQDQLAISQEQSARLQQHFSDLSADVDNLIRELATGHQKIQLLEARLQDVATLYLHEKQALLAVVAESESELRAKIEQTYKNMEDDHARVFSFCRRGMDSLGKELVEAQTELESTKTDAERVKARLDEAERHVASSLREVEERKREAQAAMENLQHTAHEKKLVEDMNDQLRMQITSANLENAELQREVTEVRQRYQAAQATANDYEVQLKALDEVMRRTEGAKQQAESMVEDLMEDARNAERTIKELRDSLTDTSAKLVESQKTAEDLGTRYRQASADLVETRAHEAELSQSVAVLETKLAQFEETKLDLKRAQGDKEALLRQIGELEKALQRAHSEYEVFKARVPELERENARLNERVVSLTADNRRLGEERESAHRAREAHAVEAQREREELRAILERERDDLRGGKLAAETKLAEAERERDAAKTALTQLRVEHELQGKNLDKALDQGRSLLADTYELKDKINGLLQQIEGLEKSLAAKEDQMRHQEQEHNAALLRQVEQAGREKSELRDRMDALKERVTTLSAHLAQEEERGKDLLGRLQQTIGELDTATRVREAVEQERRPLLAELETLKAQLANTTRERDSIRVEAERLQQGNSFLEQRLEATTGQLHDTEVQRAVLDQKLALLAESQRSLEETNTRLQRQVAGAAEEARMQEREANITLQRERENHKNNMERLAEEMHLIDKARQELLGYKDTCDALERQLSDNRTNITQLQQETISMARELAARDAAMNALQQHNVVLQQKLEHTYGSLSDANERVRDLTSRLDNAAQQGNTQAHQLHHAEAQATVLAQQLQQAKTDLARASEEIAALRQVAMRGDDYEETTSNLGYGVSRASFATSRMGSRSAGNLRLENQEQSEKLRNAERERDEYAAELQRVVESTVTVREILDQSDRALAEAKRERKEMRDQIAALEQALVIAQKDKKSVEEHRLELMQRVGKDRMGYDSEMQTLRREYALEKARAGELQKELHHLKVKLAGQTDALKTKYEGEMQQQSARLNTEARHYADVIAGLQEQLQVSQKKSTRLENERIEADAAAAAASNRVQRSQHRAEMSALELERQQVQLGNEIKAKDDLIGQYQKELANTAREREALHQSVTSLAVENADLQRIAGTAGESLHSQERAVQKYRDLLARKEAATPRSLSAGGASRRGDLTLRDLNSGPP